MSEQAIRFKQVSCRLGGREVLSDLDLTIQRGETFALLGRSGCGKTTTLKLVNRLLDPDRGEVKVESRSTLAWDAIALRRHIGYVIQDVGLFPHYTVQDNVALVPRLEGWPQARVESRVEEMLRLVGLEPERFSSRYPHQLSGGQKQRVGVARALANDPPVLLMDEPFGALDPLTRWEIQEEFRSLQQRLGKTILLVTHDLDEAFLLGNRVGLMEHGRLLFEGPPAELVRSPEPAVRSFLRPLQHSRSNLFAEKDEG